jgi:hypothetical protein
MSRSRSRVCLQDGLKLDLNRLAQRGFIKFGSKIGSRGIAWNHSYWGEVASGVISADMTDPYDAWMEIRLGASVQRINLEEGPEADTTCCAAQQPTEHDREGMTDWREQRPRATEVPLKTPPRNRHRQNTVLRPSYRRTSQSAVWPSLWPISKFGGAK